MVCQSGGKCYVNSGTALCYCQAGYIGSYCETLVNNCASSPCLHGKCINAANNYTCNCTAYYEGSNCETGKGFLSKVA